MENRVKETIKRIRALQGKTIKLEESCADIKRSIEKLKILNKNQIEHLSHSAFEALDAIIALEVDLKMLAEKLESGK